MTAFGKILTFVNLVFALITCGLIGMAYLTRTNWKASYDKVSAAAVAADASYQQLLTDAANNVRAKEGSAKKAENELAEVSKKLAAKTADAEQLQNQLAATQRTNDKDSTIVSTANEELRRSRLEVTQMRDHLNDRDTRIRNLEGQLTKTRDESVNYKLNLESLKERFQNLLAQNEELTRQLTRAPMTASARPTEKAAPAEQVRGTIKVIDGNLATISIGSDSGVKKDTVLQIYRLTPSAEYLGTLVILSSTPFEAVGRIERASGRAQVRVGDEVASKILGQK